MPKSNSFSSSSSSSNHNILGQDENGRSSLWHACHDGNAEQVRFLLNKKALINTSDADGCTPLMIACERGHIDVVNILLSHNATMEHYSLAELFKKNIVRVDAIDAGGKTALDRAQNLKKTARL